MKTVIFEQDGNQVCAHYQNFTNLQESNAGFGDTEEAAKLELFRQEAPGLCQRAMWFGDGRPAWCHEAAYGPSDLKRFVTETHKYGNIETFRWYEKLLPDSTPEFRALDMACFRHGGPKLPTPPSAPERKP